MRRKLYSGIISAFVLTAAALLPCTAAYAYFDQGPVGVSLGTYDVTLEAGQSAGVTVSFSPASSDQLPGCGMAECPQACDGLENPQTGVVGGCLNADGWCTCAGTMYSTVQTSVSVSSSNPSVARASWAGGVLSISGYRAGTVTLSISASLAKHESAQAHVSVEVVAASSNGGGSEARPDAGGVSASQGRDGAAAATDSAAQAVVAAGGDRAGDAAVPANAGSAAQRAGSGSASATNGASTTGNGSATSSTNAGTAAAVSATAAVQSTSPAVNVGAGDGAQQASADVARIGSRDGETVILARAGTDGSADLLKEAAASGGRVTFWSGGTSDSPDVSVTYYGKDLDANAVPDDFDSSVKASKKGSGTMAELLADAERSVVVEFGAKGVLPAKAEVYVRTSAVFDEGTTLGLYEVAEDGASLKLVSDGIVPKDAYASFKVEEAKVYALGSEGLAGATAGSEAGKAEAAEDGASDQAGPTASDGAPEGEGQVDATKVDVHAKSGAPYLAVAGVICAAAVAGAAMYVFMRRRARLAGEAGGVGDANGIGNADVVGDAGVVGDAEAAGDAEDASSVGAEGPVGADAPSGSESD